MDFNSELDVFNNYYPRMIEPLAKPSDFGIGPREFHYWIQQKVIDVPKSASGKAAWNRLNMYDAIWIRFVQELRRFGLPFKDIAAIKNMLFSSPTAILLSTPESELEKEFIKEHGVSEGKKMLEEVRATKADPKRLAEAMKLMYNTQLGAMFFAVVLLQRPIKIHVLIDEDSVMFIPTGMLNQKSNSELPKELEERTHLTINLYKLVEEFLVDLRFEQINNAFGFLSENEKILFAALNDKSITEINIRKGDGNAYTFSLTSTKELKDKEADQLKRILRMNDYQEVTAVFRNGKHIHLKNTQKIKTTTP